MAAVTLRSTKGSALSITEADANVANMNAELEAATANIAAKANAAATTSALAGKADAAATTAALATKADAVATATALAAKADASVVAAMQPKVLITQDGVSLGSATLGTINFIGGSVTFANGVLTIDLTGSTSPTSSYADSYADNYA